MKVLLFCAVLLVLATGCRSVDVEQVQAPGQSLSGGWCFVYYEAVDSEDTMMPGPPFDTLRFLDKERVSVRGALQNAAFMARYSFSGNDLRLRIPSAGGRELTVKCQMYLADEGRIMVLRDKGSGAVFLRDTFIEGPGELVGSWRLENAPGGVKEDVIFSHGGGIMFRAGGLRGQSRLWGSERGMMLSAFLWVPDKGVRTVVWHVDGKIESGKIRLVPYGPNGLLKKRSLQLVRNVQEVAR